MKCPHCTISVHESWFQSDVYTRAPNGAALGTPFRITHMFCPECQKPILRYGVGKVLQGNVFSAPAEWRQFYPAASARSPVPKEVPPNVAGDYTEATRVLSLSPKASAALSRRCLQTVLNQAGYAQRDLSKQIDAALAETDGRKTLPSGVHMIVDAIRNFGNFAAHTITDQTTLQIIEVEPAEAEYCLDVLDAVFDHYYAKPAQAQAIKDALNAKLAAANKPLAK